MSCCRTTECGPRVSHSSRSCPTIMRPSSSELKPEKLTHDASMSTFQTWKKQFRAYFESAQLGTLPCSQQQAYLCNCLDSVLHARIDREATGTTPVYTPFAVLFTCMAILDQTFLEAFMCIESISLMLARKRGNLQLNSEKSSSLY